MNVNLRRLTLLGVLLFGPVATTGCVSEPVLSVHHAELRGASLSGLLLTIVLQVRNDNGYDVQIRNVRAMVTLGRGYPLSPIEYSPNQWLPANQTTLLAVPVSIPWSLVPALVNDTSSYAIPFSIKGTADVTAVRSLGINRDGYPLDQTGTIPRQVVVDTARRAMPFPLPL